MIHSKVPANAAFFPVTKADRVRTATPANLGRPGRLCGITQLAALVCLGQRTLCGWRQDTGW
jgi:hypothetical protein